MNRSRIAVLLLCGSGALTAAPAVTVEDDRGRAITASLRACFTRGLETRCVDAPPWATPPGFEEFDSVTFDGPDHGPVDLQRSEFRSPVRVPRKATLRFSNLPRDLTLTAAVFYRDDSSFKRPALQLGVTGDQIRVPARPSVIALFARGSAPDLHLVAPKPGSTQTLPYRRGPGWSLVVRASTGGEPRPVAGARIELYGASSPKGPELVARAQTEKDGLAVFGALGFPFLSVHASATGVLDVVENGVGSARDGLAFREVRFDRGGTVDATVMVDGSPAGGAQCLLVSNRASSRKPAGALVPEPDVFSDTRVDGTGHCKTHPAKQGFYLLRVVPEKGGAGFDEPVSVQEGGVTDVEVSLTRIPVGGTVQRAHEPLPKALVLAVLEADLPSGGARTTFPEPMRATTDEEGRYSGYVWDAGRYSFELMPDGGRSTAADRSVEVPRGGATVDFDLNDARIEGKVVDETGAFVEGAWVVLSQPVADATIHRRGSADAEGRFRFSLEGSGSVELRAGKKGFKTSDTLTVTVSPDMDLAPLTLKLERLSSIEGRVLAPAGAPAPGVLVSSYNAAGVPMRQGDATTDANGHFLVPRARAGPTRLFATGPGCALEVADFGPDDDQVVVPCGVEPAGANLTIKAVEGRAAQDEWVFLRWNGVVVPRQVLMEHFAAYAIPWTTNGEGALSIVGLSPGNYDLFLGQGASEWTITQGQQYGFMGSFRAEPFSMTDLEFEVKYGP